jgi:hypothetical protein
MEGSFWKLPMGMLLGVVLAVPLVLICCVLFYVHVVRSLLFGVGLISMSKKRKHIARQHAPRCDVISLEEARTRKVSTPRARAER